MDWLGGPLRLLPGTLPQKQHTDREEQWGKLHRTFLDPLLLGAFCLCCESFLGDLEEALTFFQPN